MNHQHPPRGTDEIHNPKNWQTCQSCLKDNPNDYDECFNCGDNL